MRDPLKLILTFFLLFAACSVFGWVYEMLFYRIDRGRFIKRGQGLGPWLPIYGFGGLGLALLTWDRALSPLFVFLLSVIGSGVLEFAVGWALYTFCGGLRLWDYNTEIWNWGNIGGYVCARSVLIFGVFGLVLYYGMIPMIRDLVERAGSALFLPALVLAVLLLADMGYAYLVRPLKGGGLKN